MEKSKLALFRAVLFICILSAGSAEELVHVLQKGETLYSISRIYHVPAETIMSLNKLTDPDKIRAGQKLRIPDVYTVEKGDTLYGIARKLDVPVESLLSANKLEKNSILKAGKTLYVPSDTAGTGARQAVSKVAPADQTTAGPRETDLATSLPVSTAMPQKPLEDPRSYDTRKVDSSVIWPVAVKELSYLSGKIFGVSITSVKGEKVKAIASGTVLSSGPYRGFGQVAFIQSKSGFMYVYGGLEEITSRIGQSLSFGDEIGTLGSDSLSGKPQLYFMVYNKDVPVDPAKAPRGY